MLPLYRDTVPLTMPDSWNATATEVLEWGSIKFK